jgi:actin-like ATPase involved in cell morphogenesis
MGLEFLASRKVGIDLGTANILVYVKGRDRHERAVGGGAT